jgi:hypothetical protein
LKFLANNIILPFDADGNIVNIENISVSWIIMLAVEPDSYMALVIFLPHLTKILVEDKSLLYTGK